MNASSPIQIDGSPAHGQRISEKKPPIIVVTGLPRSGTSLIMQMLRAGGMELLVNDHRSPDEHNPRGYFEYEPVKRIETDSSWLPLASGKVVKVVVPLIKAIAMQEIPATIILVRRDMNAVLRSQKRMAESRGVSVSDEDQDRLAQIFAQQLDESIRLINANSQQKLIELDYESVLANPLAVANRLDKELPVCLDATAMASMVDRGLNRSGV